ncbi:recombinase family protein [Phenylobacterium immobile]|uniref:recombinase family protein n=1 Tax=Phenylobacterium immobile TaxID=21 RepID=UPI000AEC61EF|nr:recombinase family protein [Phenylobacterium immobile]
MSVRRIRCAIYTRKSSEEGLEQAFNTLNAQREACAAYVKSQVGEGWRTLPEVYDDGGFSGGTMERPALKRLMADISAGKVDVVVVYKIDRLTRSLADFARMVEVFDARQVSFVSVTQAFNTTSSMGRLTLNVLLSFAQFEREVTGERIRDKIAASKKKGMWMGGTPPLGYDLPTGTDRILVVNPAEADTVRCLFSAYLQLGSVHAVQRRTEAQGIVSKARTTAKGRSVGGLPFSRGALFHLLSNRVYRGQIIHKDAAYPGLHTPIVEAEVFDQVQQSLSAHRSGVRERAARVARPVLAGRIFDEDGQPMSPTFTHKPGGQVYRYYVSAPLQQGARRKKNDDAVRRVPVASLEARLTELLRGVAPGQTGLLAQVLRLEIHRDHVRLRLPGALGGWVQPRAERGEHLHLDGEAVVLSAPMRMQLRGGRTEILGAVPRGVQHDRALIKALRTAHAMVAADARQLPVLTEAPNRPYYRRMIRLAFLAPEIQEAILAGRQPLGLTLGWLMQQDLPAAWPEQLALVRQAARSFDVAC